MYKPNAYIFFLFKTDHEQRLGVQQNNIYIYIHTHIGCMRLLKIKIYNWKSITKIAEVIILIG